jgi:DNA-directed RNA polymerase subunit RPC12/RpoP
VNPTNVAFKCGSCSNLLSIGEELHGQMVRCPYCQQVIQVPRLQPTPGSAADAGGPPSLPPAAEIPPPPTRHDGPNWGDLLPASEAVAAEQQTETDAAMIPTVAAVGTEVQPASITFVPGAPWADHGASEAPAVSMPADGNGELVFVGASPSSPAATVEEPSTLASGESPWVATTLREAAESTQQSGSPGGSQVRTRRKLPVSVWLLSILIPYSMMSTVAAVYFLQRAQEQQIHPLESLQDQGLYENIYFDGRRRDIVPNIGALKDKAKEAIQDPLDKLAPWMPRLKLGETKRFGEIEVTALDVTRRPLEFLALPVDRAAAKDQEALVLRLKIKNVSGTVFHPDDPTFNRDIREPEIRPYTFLEIGEGRYYGFVRDPLTERVKGQNFSELLHDAELETCIVAFQGAKGERAVDALAKVAPETELVWRVHLRKGREEIQLKSNRRVRTVWTTTIVPVVFTAADVKVGTNP